MVLLNLTGISLAVESEKAGTFAVIEKVELKNNAGLWLTVMEPDHLVNLDSEEAGASFFNQGKVTEGRYINFRMTAIEARKPRQVARHIQMQLVGDLPQALSIHPGSFIAVWFRYRSKGATVTVDQDTRNWGPDAIQISKSL